MRPKAGQSFRTYAVKAAKTAVKTRTVRDSWWITAPREHFMELALQHFPQATAPVTMPLTMSPNGRYDT